MANKKTDMVRFQHIEECGDLYLAGMPKRVRVLNDDAEKFGAAWARSQEYNVVFYNDYSRCMHYDNGKDGWGAVLLPYDANLDLHAGDKVRVFWDGRNKSERMVAVTNLVGMKDVVADLPRKQLYIAKVPHRGRDMKNFMHRYLPRLSDKIKFSWALFCMAIVNGDRLRLRPSENLRSFLTHGPRQKYLDTLLDQEIGRTK